jgi:hypothetical protein
MDQYKAYKKYYLIRIILTALFGAALGAVLLVLEPYAAEVFDILLIAVGLMTAVFNLPACLFSLLHVKRKGEWINLAVSLLAIGFGVLLMLVRRDSILLVLGIFSLVLPVVRTSLVQERWKHLKRELPMILFGALTVLISLLQVEETVFFVGGLVILGLSALYLLWSLVLLHFRLAAVREWIAEQEAAQPEGEE